MATLSHVKAHGVNGYRAEAPGLPLATNGHAAPIAPPSVAVEPSQLVISGDARFIPLRDGCVDLIVTSPPYWRKRDYGFEAQIGQEETPNEYVDALVECLSDWRRVLRSTGSVFLNIGDTYWKNGLAAVPSRLEVAARDAGWIIRNRIIWAKDGGMPEPAKNRLANRHEFVLHLVRNRLYYYDLQGYAETMGNGANPGDVWHFGPGRRLDAHLAPFPRDIVERAIALSCPVAVCTMCNRPATRIVRRTKNLDMGRPQARRAWEIASRAGLSDEHIAAIQATGVSDAGKALRVQNGTGRNSERVKRLAAEAKLVLGGYFREFTFAKRETLGWSHCSCDASFSPGVVLDPFMGTGTTLAVASTMRRSSIGIDLVP